MMRKKHPIARYVRELRIVEELASSQHSQTLSQLAQRLQLPKTTLMRCLVSLREHGFVAKLPGTRGFVVGPRARHLALLTIQTPHFSRAARAILADVVSATGESCNLTALDGDEMRYVERVETHHPLQLRMKVGSRVPLHCTATGKLMLALMDDKQRAVTLARLQLIAYTTKTHTNRDTLVPDLRAIRERDVGIDEEEFVRGMVAVAVPVRDERQRMIAAIACHGPTARITLARLHQHVPALRTAATSMSLLFSQTLAERSSASTGG